MLGIARRRVGRRVLVGILVVNNQCRVAQHVIAVVVQQRRDSHRHCREQRDGREQRGETSAPESANH